jgi:hypothetical protein
MDFCPPVNNLWGMCPPPYASPADTPVVISDIEDVYIFTEIFGIEVPSSIEHANFSAIMKII